jgi:hypothetical protein
MRLFVDLVLDNLYKPLSRNSISGHLLDKVYEKLLAKILSLLDE